MIAFVILLFVLMAVLWYLYAPLKVIRVYAEQPVRHHPHDDSIYGYRPRAPRDAEWRHHGGVPFAAKPHRN